MICVVEGKQFINGTNKETGMPYKACNLSFSREPYAVENYVAGSRICKTEFIRYDVGSQLEKTLHEVPIGTEIDLVYIQRGRYNIVADVIISK